MKFSTKNILRVMASLGGPVTIERVADQLELAHVVAGAAMIRMLAAGTVRNAGLDGDKRLFVVES